MRIFFGRNTLHKVGQKEVQVQAIKKKNLQKVDRMKVPTKKLVDLLEANHISLHIFIATGGRHDT